MANQIYCRKKEYFLATSVLVTAVVFFIWGNNVMGEVKIKEARIDFIYVYGDEDSALFRIALTKTKEKTHIENIVCPLQKVLFRDRRWKYSVGEIPEQAAEKLLDKISPNRLSTLENLYTWQGTTAHHLALIQVYFLLENEKEFKKTIRIMDYPLGIEDLPGSLKDVIEITKLLQSQKIYASREVRDSAGLRELRRNLEEIDTLADEELKYYSTQAIKCASQ